MGRLGFIMGIVAVMVFCVGMIVAVGWLAFVIALGIFLVFVLCFFQPWRF